MKDYLMWILNIELKTNSSLHVFRAEIEGDIHYFPDIGTYRYKVGIRSNEAMGEFVSTWNTFKSLI